MVPSTDSLQGVMRFNPGPKIATDLRCEQHAEGLWRDNTKKEEEEKQGQSIVGHVSFIFAGVAPYHLLDT